MRLNYSISTERNNKMNKVNLAKAMTKNKKCLGYVWRVGKNLPKKLVLFGLLNYGQAKKEPKTLLKKSKRY